MGLSNARFEVKDVTTLGEVGRYDLITAFDAIHDQARPATVLFNIATALRPERTFLMQDIAGASHVHNTSTIRSRRFCIPSRACITRRPHCHKMGMGLAPCGVTRRHLRCWLRSDLTTVW